MNNWKVVGYICLGRGSVILIYALYVVCSMMAAFRQIPYLAQTSVPIALAAAAPYLVLGSFIYVIGGVGLYAGRDSAAMSIASSSAKVTKSDFLDRLNRLEGIVDNNFSVITKRLDEIQEKQNMFSRNTIIKAKKE